MKTKKEDRRIGRTRRMMREALVSLIVEKGYEKITVQDILDRADVGRSTFYSHYRDKDDLLLGSFDHLRSMLEQQQSLQAAVREGPDVGFDFVLAFFRHAGEKAHLSLYKAMVGKESGQMILKYLHRYLFDLLREPFAASLRGKRRPQVPIDVTVRWYVSSLLSLLTWWLDANVPFPAEHLAEYFRLLTAPGLVAALDGDGRGLSRHTGGSAARTH
ncbi:MAG TPA: TetR/AcrR family transcriptional regulator [bacterium]